MKVLKSWGTDGKVVLSLGSEDLDDFAIDEPVFINFDELPVPFFFESIESKGNRIIAKFEDVDDAASAEELIGKEIFFEDEYDDDQDDSPIGMLIRDADGTVIGSVVDFTDFAGNTCITVDYNGKEILIPFHEDLVMKVEDDTITMNIPQGLL